jgi:hypothetical protein
MSSAASWRKRKGGASPTAGFVPLGWLSAPAAREPAVETNQAGGEAAPFRFLHEAAGDTLTKLLEKEHPQTIAVVASHLPPERAAEALTQLAPQLQADVLRRIVDLDETDPEIIREVEQQMERVLSDQLRTVRRRSAGLSAVNAILSAADSPDRKELLSNVAACDQRLASLLNQPVQPRPDTGPALGRDSSSAKPSQTAPAKPPLPIDLERNRVWQRDDRSPQPDGPVPVGPIPDGSIPNGTVPNGTVPNGTLPNGTVPNGTVPNDALPNGRITPPQVPPPSAPAGAEGGEAPKTLSAGDEELELAFDDLAQLDDPSLAEVLRSADPQVVLLALTGASPDLVGRIRRRLPSREAKALKRKLEQIGPVRLRDVEHAQQQLARLASRLAARGLIRPPGTRRFAVAA